jgi:hypothetical protein
MNAGMAPSHHDDVALGDDVMHGPLRIKRVEQVGDPLLQSGSSRSLLGERGVVEVILRDDRVQGRQIPAVEDALLVAADDRLVGFDAYRTLRATPGVAS